VVAVAKAGKNLRSQCQKENLHQNLKQLLAADMPDAKQPVSWSLPNNPMPNKTKTTYDPIPPFAEKGIFLVTRGTFLVTFHR